MEMNEKEYNSVLLGALLHDVGKLFEKSNDNSKKHWEEGGDFIQLYKDELYRNGFNFELLEKIIRMHHKQQWKAIDDLQMKSLVGIVHCSDGYSAGERDKESEKDKGKKPLKHYPLDSIFANIHLQNDTDAEIVKNYNGSSFHHSPKQLSFTDIFPSAYDLPNDETSIDAVKNEYNKLKEGFVEAFNLLMTNHHSTSSDDQKIDSMIVSLYSLFYKYTWCVPDDVGRKIRDISLFDHTRITAAISACLYIYHCANNTLNDIEKIVDNNETKFLLIAGDLSGIQEYLYNIASIGAGGVAKRLRTRSFFLSSLVEVVSHRILKECIGDGIELPIMCKIMASGGNFILLVPNLNQLTKNVNDITNKINGWLLKEFQGDLSFSSACLPLTGADFEIERDDTKKTEGHKNYIIEKLLALHQELDKKKTNKLIGILSLEGGDGEEAIWQQDRFVKDEIDFPYGDCPSCKKNPAGAKSEQVSERLCSRCDSDRRFSELLVKAKYFCYSERKAHNDDQYDFFDGKYSVKIAKNKSEIPDDAYLVQVTYAEDIMHDKPCFLSPYANYVACFKNRNELKRYCADFCGKKNPLGECEFYTCLMNPDDCETKTGIRPSGFPAVKPFDCLAAFSEGEKLLGILKADVDRLGLIFSEGFGAERASLSRIATLSRMVDLFFSGWVDHTLRYDNRFSEIYTVYSGGDDLLLLGPWDNIIDLSKEISDSFRKYVAFNPQVTISAGIAVTKAKFPIAKSSRLADSNLDSAKKGEKLKSKIHRRNRLNVFGTNAVWFKKYDEEIEVAELFEWSDEILKAMINIDGKQKISGGLVHNLLNYAEMCKRWMEDKDRNIMNLRYLPLTSYTIGRMTDENRMKYLLKKLIVDLNKQICFSKFRMPITCALLKNRGGRN
jgi:CRISPR-associated protein Csm1